MTNVNKNESKKTNKNINPLLTEIMVEKIFLTFSRMFGHRWQKLFEDMPARKIWHRTFELENITDEMIGRGLERCKSLEWPPSLGEFIKLCQTKKNHIPKINSLAYKPFNGLPKPKVDKIKARQAINQMRLILSNHG